MDTMTIRHAVLTAIGPDRIGIVDDIAARLGQAGCNIEESKMAVLGGEFAVIMLITGEKDAIDALIAGADEWGAGLGLSVTVKPTKAPEAADGGLPYLIESSSLDTQGIVHGVTALFRRHAINVEELETDTVAAPWTGSPMFQMRVRIIIPRGVRIADLKEELAALSHERDLDITLTPLR